MCQYHTWPTAEASLWTWGDTNFLVFSLHQGTRGVGMVMYAFTLSTQNVKWVSTCKSESSLSRQWVADQGRLYNETMSFTRKKKNANYKKLTLDLTVNPQIKIRIVPQGTANGNYSNFNNSIQSTTSGRVTAHLADSAHWGHPALLASSHPGIFK